MMESLLLDDKFSFLCEIGCGLLQLNCWKFLCIWKIERNGIKVVKFEPARIYFWRVLYCHRRCVCSSSLFAHFMLLDRKLSRFRESNVNKVSWIKSFLCMDTITLNTSQHFWVYVSEGHRRLFLFEDIFYFVIVMCVFSSITTLSRRKLDYKLSDIVVDSKQSAIVISYEEIWVRD